MRERERILYGRIEHVSCNVVHFRNYKHVLSWNNLCGPQCQYKYFKNISKICFGPGCFCSIIL